MMLTAKPNTVEVSCDRCGAALRTAGADRTALWVRAQELGWQAERLGGMWWHRCPECVRRGAGA
ncbi:hypothetical protein [Dactylosporangium sp. CS-033363]|uniref:hypothetical protein n=1 Tax=Dactylosporangium sp. CS-033363 TaxID=3239935 RepID=UPI003D8B9382